MDASGRTIPTDKILTVAIKAGWKAGTKIKFAGEGDETPNGVQDLEFVIQEKPFGDFTRDGNDLKTQLKISLVEAFCGFEKSVDFLDGSKVSVKNKDSRTTQPGTALYFKGLGMPISKTPNTRGDLYITINVELPTILNDVQRKQVHEMFG